MNGPEELKDIYSRRFYPDLDFRNRMWAILCKQFFQKFIPKDATILEIAAGYCEFINHIKAKEKFAIDLNPDSAKFSGKDVTFKLTPSWDLSFLVDKKVDVFFTSNFFEHITKAEIVATLREINQKMSRGGIFIVLQPNYRYTYKDYWMFFDHITPLDDRSLVEVFESNNYQIDTCIPRFLPYTTKIRLQKSTSLLQLYIKFPFLWRFFGGQALIVARKRSDQMD